MHFCGGYLIKQDERARGGWTHGAHQGVENADGEGGATGKRLCEVQLRVWVVIVVLVQELNV